MKYRKRVFSILLAVTLLIVSTPASLATNGLPSGAEMYEYLLAQDIPAEYLDKQDQEGLEKLYLECQEYDIEYSCNKTTSYLTVTEDGIMPAANIPESDMTLTISAHQFARVTNVWSEVYRVQVEVEYQWSGGKPFVRNEDLIALNWDPNVLVFDGAFAHNKFTTFTTRVRYDESEENPGRANQGGIGVYVPIDKTITSEEVYGTNTYGQVLFDLTPRNTLYLSSYSGADATQVTVGINANYVHSENIGGLLQPSFSAEGFGFTIDMSGLCSETSATTTCVFMEVD